MVAYLLKPLSEAALLGEVAVALERADALRRGGLATQLARMSRRLDLTQRQSEVLERLVTGRSNKEIASELGCGRANGRAACVRLVHQGGDSRSHRIGRDVLARCQVEDGQACASQQARMAAASKNRATRAGCRRRKGRRAAHDCPMDTCKLRRFGWMAVVVALVMGCGTRARGPRPLHAASTSMGAAHLWLPGHTGPQWVNYEVVDGDAYFEGDINLGPVATLTERYHAARAPIARVPIVGAKHATAVTSKSSLWPGGVIPYELGSGLSERHRQWCVDAARTVTEKTVLTVRPRMLGDKDYVVFTKTGRGCHSKLGRVGGAQKIGAYGCGPPTLVHELLHAAGFYHEQSRPDRDSYVEIIWSEIRPGGESQFRKREKARTFGPLRLRQHHALRRALPQQDRQAHDALQDPRQAAQGERRAVAPRHRRCPRSLRHHPGAPAARHHEATLAVSQLDAAPRSRRRPLARTAGHRASSNPSPPLD